MLIVIQLPFLHAHPHIYIDLSLEIATDKQGISGFWEDWTILKNFGENICTEYDIDNDGIFNSEETEVVRRDLFSNIAEYNYYTYLEINGTTYFPSEATDFSVRKTDGTATFRFFVPCRITSEEILNTYKLTILDLSKYVSFGIRYIDDPINESINYVIDIERTEEYYSHSNMFGNAIFLLKLKPPARIAEPASIIKAGDQLIKLNPENISPTETSSNPFFSPGVRVKDDNPNPFLTY